MKRSRSITPVTSSQPQSASVSNSDFIVFTRLKLQYKQRFARYLFSIWSNVPPMVPRSPVFEIAGKRAVLTLSSRENAVMRVNMNSPQAKFLHLAILNEQSDIIHFSINRGVRYPMPPSNQSVWAAVSSLIEQVPFEYYPIQLQPPPPMAESTTKRIRNNLRL